MPIQVWLAFVGAATVAILYPGPTMITVIRYSLTYGPRSYVPLLIGVTLGDATALGLSFAAFLGLASLDPSGFWLMLVNLASGLYLLYFGVKLLRADASPAKLNAPRKSRSRWQLFAYIYLITALNLKSIPLLLMLLKQAVHGRADVFQALGILAVTFLGLSMVISTLYMRFAPTARTLVASPRAQRRFHIAGGLLLSAVGVWALADGLRWVQERVLL